MRRPVSVSSEILPDSFWERVEKVGACWIWTGTTSGGGYGSLRKNGRTIRVHRLIYSLVKGPILAPLQVLHTCDNKRCLNPSHLYAGTPVDNARDMTERDRHYRPQGGRNPAAKLRERQIQKIRALREKGKTYREIGDIFDIHPSYARRVALRKRWKHV